jgi:Zn-dependent peptidase ImmA (M78 family)
VSNVPSYVHAACRARDLITELQIQDPAEIVIEKIAPYKRAPVRYARLEGCHGRMVRSDHTALITVNEAITRPGQRRMIIAHELGHVILHPHIKQMDEVDVTQTRNFNHRQRPEELEANYFAAELLMPKQFFKPVVNRCEPGWAAIRQLATRYQTTQSAAAIQFVHFSNEPVILIASENGTRRWYVVGDQALDFFPREEDSVHRYSCASVLLQGTGTQERAQDVPAGMWLRGYAPNGKEYITEDSMRARDSRFVLTLLWIHEAI